MSRRRGNHADEVIEPDEAGVFKRLAEIGFPLAKIAVGMYRAHLLGADVKLDPSFPPTFGGMETWGHANGNTRATMKDATPPWTFDNTDNIPWVVSPDGKIGFTVVRGNKWTGIDNRARTRRPRGSAGIRMIRRNNTAQIQMLTLAKDGQRGDVVKLPTGRQNYFLLYNQFVEKRMDLDIDIVRWELSLAKGVTSDGRLIDWTERLVLPAIDMNGRPDGGGGGSGQPLAIPPAVDVPVERMAS